MSIAQEAFYIPDDIATGLATGAYRRIGSVVRYAAGPNRGQIVKHLQPVEPKRARSLSTKALQLVQQHKKEAGIGAACAAAIGLGLWGYAARKQRGPQVLTEFRAAMKAYVDAVRNGSMDIDTIDSLMDALEALKRHRDHEKLSIQLSTEELDVLVGRIHAYTVQLARDHSVELSDEELHPSRDGIIDLQSCLRAQKRIFETAA